jgi:putative glutamine amidotransferase
MRTIPPSPQEHTVEARPFRLLESPSAPVGAALSRPRIGIFASRGVLREGVWPAYSGDLQTVEALAEAGAIPLLLPSYPLLPEADVFDLLGRKEAFRFVFEVIWASVARLDGLLFAGGGDLDARFFYQAIPHPQLQAADLWRDIWEWMAALIAWALFQPTLGICRGMQLLNVVLGGTLFQDHTLIPRSADTPLLKHGRGRPLFEHLVSHPLHVVPGTWLAQAIRSPGRPRYALDQVLSQHHNFVGRLTTDSMEVIGDLAQALLVVGYSPDRVIEALGAKDQRRFYAGVQFHPEYDPSQAWAQGIFRLFVQHCAQSTSLLSTQDESLREEIFAWLWLHARASHGLRDDDDTHETFKTFRRFHEPTTEEGLPSLAPHAG